MTWLPLLTGTITFGAFAWAVASQFQREPMPLQMRLLSALGSLTFAAFLLSAWHRGFSELLPLGAALHVLALALFAWAMRYAGRETLPIAFSSKQSSGVIASGPYLYLRHPLYTSYSIYWLGILVAAPSLWLAAPVALLLGCYAYLAVSEERALLAGPHGDEYRAYRQQARIRFRRSAQPMR